MPDIRRTSAVTSWLQATPTVFDMSMKIRIAKESDGAAISEIYSYYVENTAITYEYDPPSADEMSRRIVKTLERYPYLVLEDGGEIKGYAYAGPLVDRRAADHSAEVSIYVKKGESKKGYGGALYRALEEVLKKQNVINLCAAIAYTERDDEYLTANSVEYHTHMGYRFVGRFDRSGYKFGRWYDLVWMEKLIGEHPTEPEYFVPFSLVGKIEF